MANWQSKLYLGDVYHAGLPIPELAGHVAERLRGVPPFKGLTKQLLAEQEKLMEEFESLATDQASTADDFDEVMERLYDWADTRLDDMWPYKKVCWVDTITRRGDD